MKKYVLTYLGGHAHTLSGICPDRAEMTSVQDLLEFYRGHRHDRDAEGHVPATFILDTDVRLWLAARRSEHVVCARGMPVLTAGEMFIHRDGGEVRVVRVSNQSTGYCPPVDTWDILADVLKRLGIGCPEGFEPACEFRRCVACRGIQIVKDSVYECTVCGAALPVDWNLGGSGTP
jgi:hypothetical protein